MTGVLALLNISLNAAGRPIVEMPKVAFVAVRQMTIDALAIEDLEK